MAFRVLVDQPITDAMMKILYAQGCRTTLWASRTRVTPDMADMEGFYVYGHARIDGNVMDQMPLLRVISNMGVGVDHIDLEQARARGVRVGHTPGFVDGATADMAFLLLMAIARNLHQGIDYARGPAFRHFDPSLLHGSEVHGAVLGILGLGAIGSEVARRAAGFDMTVVYHNRRRVSPALEKALDVRYASKTDLLRQADYVLLATPLTPETAGFIGQAEFRQMKSTAYLVNIARGGLVAHADLLQALNNGLIAGAALDVTEPEPLARDHPLVQHPNVIITPHLGSATRQTRHGMFMRSVENLMAGLKGQPLPNEVPA